MSTKADRRFNIRAQGPEGPVLLTVDANTVDDAAQIAGAHPDVYCAFAHKKVPLSAQRESEDGMFSLRLRGKNHGAIHVCGVAVPPTKAPAHEPGTEWSRAEVEALLAEHERPVDAARAAGITRQRVRQLMERFGLAPPKPRNPAERMLKGRTLAPVRVILRCDQLAWLEGRALLPAGAVRAAVDALMKRGVAPAYVPSNGPRKGASYALRPDQHAWLNALGRGQRSALVQQAVDMFMIASRPRGITAKALAETKARVGAMRAQGDA